MNAQNLAFWGFAITAFTVLGFAMLVLWKIFRNEISLDGLVAETQADSVTGIPKASLSRFQFLIFTFVIAGLYLLLSIEAGTFVDVPTNVLLLLGISSGSYVVSKTISEKDGVPPARPAAVKKAGPAP